MNSASFNERAVLDHLLGRPSATVQQVAEQTALPASTVVNICGRLQERGLIVRGPSIAHGRGRPAITYRAALPGMVAVVAFDGSHVDATLFDDHAEPIARHSSDLVRIDRREQAVQLVDELTTRLLAEAGANRRDLAVVTLMLNAIGRSDGSVTSGSVLPWVSSELIGAVRQRMNARVVLVPASVVLAEFVDAADGPVECLLRFNVGDGVSSHTTLHGRVTAGRNNLAGELGHITIDPAGPLCGCGKRGCVEALVSGPAIQQRALEAARRAEGGSMLDPAMLESAAVRIAIDLLWRAWQAEDAAARQVIDDVLDRLAWALSVAINLHDPDVVRIDGYVLRDRQAWIDQLATRVRPLLPHGDARLLTVQNARSSTLDQHRLAAYQCLMEHAGGQPHLRVIPA